MSYNYRCTTNRCRKRITKKKRIIDGSLRKIDKCRVCGGKLSLDLSLKIRNRKNKCNCDGYHFPHRKGTEPWCHHAKIGPTEEDFQDRYYRIQA